MTRRSSLAIHPGALGDVLLAVPALRAFRAGDPDASLTLAAQPRIAALLADLGVADAAVDLDALGLAALFAGGMPAPPAPVGAGRLVCWMGARDAGFVVRLRALVPGAIVAPAAGAPADGDVWAHVLGTVGAPPGDWRRALTVPARLREQGHDLLRRAGWDGRARLLVVHPGAGGVAKCWPAPGFAAIVEHGARAGLGVVVHEGPAPADAAAVAALRSAGATAIWLRQPALPALAGALAQAAVYVGNDSGVSHLAAAVGVPSVVLFTAATIRWRPWSSSARSVLVTTGSLVDADVSSVGSALDTLI